MSVEVLSEVTDQSGPFYKFLALRLPVNGTDSNTSEILHPTHICVTQWLAAAVTTQAVLPRVSNLWVSIIDIDDGPAKL